MFEISCQDASVLFENHWTPEPETLISAWREIFARLGGTSQPVWRLLNAALAGMAWACMPLAMGGTAGRPWPFPHCGRQCRRICREKAPKVRFSWKKE